MADRNVRLCAACGKLAPLPRMICFPLLSGAAVTLGVKMKEPVSPFFHHACARTVFLAVLESKGAHRTALGRMHVAGEGSKKKA